MRPTVPPSGPRRSIARVQEIPKLSHRPPLAQLPSQARPTLGALLCLSALAAMGMTLFLAPTTLRAQTPDMRSAEEWCDSRDNDRDRERLCEVREERIAAGGRLQVEGQNGGIDVQGWDGSDVLVRSRVTVRAESLNDAEEIMRRVEVRTDGNQVRADGPRTDRREYWGVSYEVFVPRTMDLNLETSNGGISVANVSGDIRFQATNGGVVLEDLAGQVQGRTTNGGLRVRLAGTEWDGEGMDVTTTNGGVRLEVPANYSADLEAGTTNGGIELDFPVTVQGRIGRQLKTTLGNGGAPLRVRTTNGGVRVVRR